MTNSHAWRNEARQALSRLPVARPATQLVIAAVRTLASDRIRTPAANSAAPASGVLRLGGLRVSYDVGTPRTLGGRCTWAFRTALSGLGGLDCAAERDNTGAHLLVDARTVHLCVGASELPSRHVGGGWSCCRPSER